MLYENLERLSMRGKKMDLLPALRYRSEQGFLETEKTPQ